MKRFVWLVPLLLAFVFSSLACEKAPQVEWELYKPEVMEDAQFGDQPILAYFYAAWCPPCYELRKRTFRDPELVEKLSNYRRIKFDMSYRHSEKIRALHQRFRVAGLPHMILMMPRSDESEWVRISGFVSGKRMMQYMEMFENRSG